MPDQKYKKLEGRVHFECDLNDTTFEKEVHLKLFELLAIAPPGARAEGWVRPSEGLYLAEMIIDSPFRRFASEAVSGNPKYAVKKALERLEEEVFRWRFGKGTGSFGSPSGMAPSGRVPVAV